MKPLGAPTRRACRRCAHAQPHTVVRGPCPLGTAAARPAHPRHPPILQQYSTVQYSTAVHCAALLYCTLHQHTAPARTLMRPPSHSSISPDSVLLSTLPSGSSRKAPTSDSSTLPNLPSAPCGVRACAPKRRGRRGGGRGWRVEGVASVPDMHPGCTVHCACALCIIVRGCVRDHARLCVCAYACLCACARAAPTCSLSPVKVAAMRQKRMWPWPAAGGGGGERGPCQCGRACRLHRLLQTSHDKCHTDLGSALPGPAWPCLQRAWLR